VNYSNNRIQIVEEIPITVEKIVKKPVEFIIERPVENIIENRYYVDNVIERVIE
jgi:hypothetical protein